MPIRANLEGQTFNHLTVLALLGPKPSDDYSRWATKTQQMRNQRCDNCERLKKRIEELESIFSEV